VWNFLPGFKTFGENLRRGSLHPEHFREVGGSRLDALQKAAKRPWGRFDESASAGNYGQN
jgi:hypothetical protein